jgi:hypothetical protein
MAAMTVNQRSGAPTPIEGMRVIDPARPMAPWRVVQADFEAGDGVVYIERQEDGHLFHHTRRSWERAWANGWLEELPSVPSRQEGMAGSTGARCLDEKEKVAVTRHDVERVAQAMADFANRDRYVLENGSQSTGVEPYEHCADDFRDLAEVAVATLRGRF